MVNSKAIHCSTPSATYSTCSTSWLMTNYTQNGPQKSWQVETASRVGKSRCYSCFLVFFSCIGEWLHDARCFHLEGCHQIGKWLMCAPDMLHPLQLGSGLTMTYRLQSTRWCEVETPEPIFRSCGILILSATGKKWFRCLFELLVHLNPLQGGLRTGEARDA